MALLSKLSSLIIRRRQIPNWGCLVPSYVSSFSSLYEVSVTRRTFCTTEDPTITPLSSFADSPVESSVYKWAEVSKLGLHGNIQEMQRFPFHELIDSYVSNHKFDKALEVLEFVIMSNFQLQQSPFSDVDVEGFNDFLEYLCKQDRIDLALRQFKRINDSSSHSPLPNTRTFEIIMVSLCDKQMAEECILLLDQLFDLLNSSTSTAMPPSLDFYTHVLPFLCKAKQPDKVSRLLTIMRDSGIELHDPFFDMSDVYDDVVEEYCQLHRFGDAAKFLEQHSVQEPDSHNILLSAYCSAGMFDVANDYLDKMIEEDQLNFYSFTILIRGLCAHEEIYKAFTNLIRMITFIDEFHVKDPDPTCTCLTSGGRGLVQTSETCSHLMDTCISYLPDSCDGVLRLAMYATLISGVWKKGHKHAADKSN